MKVNLTFDGQTPLGNLLARGRIDGLWRRHCTLRRCRINRMSGAVRLGARRLLDRCWIKQSRKILQLARDRIDGLSRHGARRTGDPAPQEPILDRKIFLVQTATSAERGTSA